MEIGATSTPGSFLSPPSLLSSSPPSLSSPSYPTTDESTTPHGYGLYGPVNLLPQLSNSEDNSSVTSSASNSATPIRTFKIPDIWRPSVMECIFAESEAESRKLLIPTIRNEMVRDLVTQMYAVWQNPSRQNCTEVAKKLVKKYPFMKDEGASVSGYVGYYNYYYKHNYLHCCFLKGSWEKKLIDRVHNTKGSAKRKAVGKPEGSREPKRGRPRMSQTLLRYPPISVSSIDECTVEAHIQKIKAEMERQSPRKQILLPLMEHTFVSRRELILSDNGISISELLSTYSCLKLYPVVRIINLF